MGISLKFISPLSSSHFDLAGTGKMTVREGALQGVACPTISAALDARFIAFDKDARVAAEPILKKGAPSSWPDVNRQDLIRDVKDALYAAKICSYVENKTSTQ